jgi:putative effector of murein hydrolase LrgA (UPF0299 family)
MIIALALILMCQLAGEVLTRGMGLPIPGPVLGMAILFVVLMARSRFPMLKKLADDGVLEQTGTGILASLSLLFVPAGVGIIQRLDILADHWVAVGIALLASTALAMAVTVLTFRLIAGNEDAS